MQRDPDLTIQEIREIRAGKTPLTWRVVPDGRQWMIVDDDTFGYFDKSDAVVTFGFETERGAQACLTGALMSWARRFPERVQ